MKRNRNLKKLFMAGVGIAGLYMAMRKAAKIKGENKNIDDDNQYIKDKAVKCNDGTYERTIKPALDKILSFSALILLSPLYAIISIAVYLDDPGPVFFTQKRVGKDGRLFELHKYRTMLLSAPHDVPTHQLKNPTQYITGIGKFLRKTSLDELPQIWDIFRGKMSIIGPRPALWNQEDLVEEREKYGANNVLPGLTGWAQINGRDELEIFEKAKFDGEYVKHLKQGGIQALFFDAKCFVGTVASVLKKNGVVEGGTGRINGEQSMEGFDSEDGGSKKSILVVCQYYYPEPFRITDICEELVKRGHEVMVLTGEPNYPEGERYPGYEHGARTDEVINGVRVHRCYTVPRKKGNVSRLLNYYSYMASSVAYVCSGRCLTREGKPFDAVFCNQLSPVMMAKAGIVYKKRYKVPLILYCLDLWPESLIAGGMSRESGIFKYFYYVSRGIYRSADRLCVSSRMFADYLCEKFGMKKEKIKYFPQYAEELFTLLLPKKENGYTDLMFAGNIGEIQSIDTMIEAAEILKDEKVKFHIVGSGTDLERLQKIVREKGLNNIIFYGRKSLEEMPELYKKADAMLITMKADPVMSFTLPGKVQTYLACGKPIIGAINGETARIIKEAKCGFCGAAEDGRGLAENIRKFMGLSDAKVLAFHAVRYYYQHFDKKVIIDKLEKLICGDDGGR